MIEAPADLNGAASAGLGSQSPRSWSAICRILWLVWRSDVRYLFARHASAGWHPCLSSFSMPFLEERDMGPSLRWDDGTKLFGCQAHTATKHRSMNSLSL